MPSIYRHEVTKTRQASALKKPPPLPRCYGVDSALCSCCDTFRFFRTHTNTGSPPPPILEDRHGSQHRAIGMRQSNERMVAVSAAGLLATAWTVSIFPSPTTAFVTPPVVSNPVRGAGATAGRWWSRPAASMSADIFREEWVAGRQLLFIFSHASNYSNCQLLDRPWSRGVYLPVSPPDFFFFVNQRTGRGTK